MSALNLMVKINKRSDFPSLGTVGNRVFGVCLSVLIFATLSGAGEARAATSRSAAGAGSAAKMNEFVSKLMAKMTLAEKAGQLVQYTAELETTGAYIKDNYRDDVKKGMVGSILNAYTPKFTRELQKLAVENSRLKIPLLIAFDVIHGFRTAFPIPLGESSSWDLALMEATARTAAREASAEGIHWTFAPMVDLTRDPRWGRVMEGAGEDPWFGAKVAAARVRGFQGDGLERIDTLLACVKHFAAYGAAEGGREYNVVDMSERQLFENYLPPFKAAIDAGVGSLMPSFNEIAGVPSTASEWLLGDLLRKQWKFKGLVVTDYTAINELVKHGVAADEKAAGLLAFRAGSEVDMMGGIYAKYIPAYVKEGKIKMASLDAAVRRILEIKYRRGLFSDPYRFSVEERAKKEGMKKENRELAREAGRRSIVLLKNSNEALPLKRGEKLAVVGPLADDRADLTGNWAGGSIWEKSVSLREGLEAAVGDKGKLIYAKGSNLIEEKDLIDFLNFHAKKRGPIVLDSRSADDMIREAVKAAKKSDKVVVALGEMYLMSGEAASRARIRLPEPQQALLRALHQTGKPIILVLMNGRPLVLQEEVGLADAIVETWFLGTETGNAAADVLFGDYNPSGKLTMSFPRSEGQIPVYYARKNTGRPAPWPASGKDKYTSRYIDSPNEPLFPFGFGLSYTRFEYSNLKLSGEKMKPGDKLKVTFRLTNAGARDGEETAQLYVRDIVASVTRPLKQLRGFEKVRLKAGESREITFELALEDLKFYDQKMRWIAEPGEFTVMVGGNSADVIEKSFTLVSANDPVRSNRPDRSSRSSRPR